MSGKARSRGGTVALGVALVLSCALGCDDTNEFTHNCRDLCEHVASLECADPVDSCVSDCQDAEAELPAACKDEWQAILDCATEADFSCEPTPCDPSSLEACPTEPQFEGCDDERDAFVDCDPADDCAIADGSESSVTPDGRSAEYVYTSLCDRCPSSPGSGMPGTCAGPEDCEVTCCDCADVSFTAQMCIDGICADSDEVCDASFGVCSLF